MTAKSKSGTTKKDSTEKKKKIAKKKSSAKTSTKSSTKKSGTKSNVKSTIKKSSAKKTAKKAVDKTKKSTVVKPKSNSKQTTKSKAKKKKFNLLRIYTEMNKLSADAVDREVIKRFKILIDTGEEDITKVSMNLILKEPKNVNVSSFHESLQPYIKHYLFLYKREHKKK